MKRPARLWVLIAILMVAVGLRLLSLSYPSGFELVVIERIMVLEGYCEYLPFNPAWVVFIRSWKATLGMIILVVWIWHTEKEFRKERDFLELIERRRRAPLD